MSRARPEKGDALSAIGRAERHKCIVQGIKAEVWSLPKSDTGLAQRLVSFGQKGLGGFEDSGEDDEGVFLVRRVPSQTVDVLAKGEKLEGLTAIGKVRDVARALAHCERSAVFPGPLRPGEVALSSEGRTDAFVLADSWVRALVGEPHGTRGTTGPSPRWTPPEQASGASWDNAANRYVLGLVAYRLIAGAHPASGVGLRDALSAQASAPPPFEEAIARKLRPGIQSLVLAMLDPDAKKRPESAEAIVRRCEELLRGDALVGAVPRSVVREEPKKKEAKAVAAPMRTKSARRFVAFVPLALGLAIAGAGFAASAMKEEPKPIEKRAIGSTKPLEKTNSETCGSCHATQVAEWQRSVMAHSVKSPLFGALESVVEEQVGVDDRCPQGAGVLRRAGGDACRDEKTGLVTTGTGGEHWCVNCHSAGDNLRSTVPTWGSSSRKPLRDVLSASAMEGISCAVCHQTIGPVHEGRGYQGNPTWTSPVTGAVFRMRPDGEGISNSGYLLDQSVFLSSSLGSGGDPIVHRRPPSDTKKYLQSSEFCGACHDVRLFGTDSLGVKDRGEHFKRLRNAYSEWRTWADSERAAGRKAASCQDCHMSLFPGVCVPGDGAERTGCPAGTHFESRAPGEKARGMIASSSVSPKGITSHYFTSVDLPLATEFPDGWAKDATLDANGVPLGLEARRAQLLRHTFDFRVATPARVGSRIEIPVEIRNVGAGHRVPAGFSQEREIWVELVVKDARGSVVYEVGKIGSDNEDLRDKVFTRITTRDDVRDFKGRPQGVFGADIVDGPDVPKWSPNPVLGGTIFRGRGLINMQNGFLRCVKCIGFIDGEGKCQAAPGQGRTRADRFDDGVYDIDTGECRSNLVGQNAFFETYFPVGALDADRGVAKAPDAIIDTRSAPPGVTLRYTYEIDAVGFVAPYKVEARLRFRPFPPFLLRAFADYEARKATLGLRPSGAQVTPKMFERNHPIDLADVSAKID
jgi:eukaryotic-like serine/threonine-protein kinase